MNARALLTPALALVAISATHAAAQATPTTVATPVAHPAPDRPAAAGRDPFATPMPRRVERTASAPGASGASRAPLAGPGTVTALLADDVDGVVTLRTPGGAFQALRVGDHTGAWRLARVTATGATFAAVDGSGATLTLGLSTAPAGRRAGAGRGATASTSTSSASRSASALPTTAMPGTTGEIPLLPPPSRP